MHKKTINGGLRMVNYEIEKVNPEKSTKERLQAYAKKYAQIQKNKGAKKK